MLELLAHLSIYRPVMLTIPFRLDRYLIASTFPCRVSMRFTARGDSLMKLLFPIATMLVGFLILGQTALAAQSIIKVGVLAPDRGLQSWLGDQIGAGAKFAIDQEQMNDCKSTIGPNLTIIAIGGPLLDEVGVEQAVDSLMGSGVDVIIGGSTRSDATILRSVVSDRNIPTILLAESQSAKSNPHVLQMVLSQENVYRVAFGKWLDVVEDINS